MHLWPSGPSKWYPGKHLLFASYKIAHAVRRGNGRICISMPPRHGKSRLVGEAAIPWFLEQFPERHVILISYNGDKAQEWGRKARDTIRSRPDLFSVSVREDMARVDRFETDAGSEAHFLGINGGVTGKGGHLVIIDDYIKDITEALSPAFRERQWMQFLANLDTRLEPGATVIIVATRWHSDDLIGRVTQRMEDWEVISLPAIALENDAIGREPGEPLFPERYDLKRLEQIRRARAGTYLWESMYQQRPMDDTMGFTDPEWFQILDRLSMAEEAELQKVRAWDLAATSAGGDWTVGGLLGKHTPSSGCYIMNVKRKQLSPADVEKMVRTTAEADGRDVTILIEQEPGSSGKALVEHYQRNVLPDFHVVPIATGAVPKLSRARLAPRAQLINGASFGCNSRGTRCERRPRICPKFALTHALCSCYVLRASTDMLCAVHPSFTLENTSNSEG